MGSWEKALGVPPAWDRGTWPGRVGRGTSLVGGRHMKAPFPSWLIGELRTVKDLRIVAS